MMSLNYHAPPSDFFHLHRKLLAFGRESQANWQQEWFVYASSQTLRKDYSASPISLGHDAHGRLPLDLCLLAADFRMKLGCRGAL